MKPKTTAAFYIGAYDPNCPDDITDDGVPMKGRKIQTRLDADSLANFMGKHTGDISDIEDKYEVTLDWSGDESSIGLTSEEIPNDTVFDAVWADLMNIIKDVVETDAVPTDYTEI